MSAIATPHILERTIAALDDDTKREAALVILRFLPGKSAATTTIFWTSAGGVSGWSSPTFRARASPRRS